MHRNEREILLILFRENRPLTIYEISDQSGMSWVTAKKYLRDLFLRRFVEMVSDNKRYIISPGLIDALVKYDEAQ